MMEVQTIVAIAVPAVMSFVGTKAVRLATGLSGNMKLRSVAVLFAAAGVALMRAYEGNLTPKDVEDVVTAVVEVAGVTLAAHFAHKATKKE